MEKYTEPQVMSVPEMARILGLGRVAAYDAVRRGDIPHIRIGRRIVIPVRALEKMLDGARLKPRDGYISVRDGMRST